MKTLIIFTLLTFFGSYPKASEDAIKFIQKNQKQIDNTLSDLTEQERNIAMAIVAPEISQFSTFTDFFEMRSLYIMYLNSGTADFSVGYFQMKPSFVETLESYVEKNKSLQSRFSKLLPKGSERERREFRLKKLGSLEGQLQYLDLFMAVAKMKTAKLKFSDLKSKIRYWATMYNSGLGISYDKNLSMQKRKLFPREEKTFNYSEVVYEFYQKLMN